jgi:uncharacterized protein (TIGR02145 family)
MKKIRILSFVLSISLILFGCKKDEHQNPIQLPDHIFAGRDTIVMDTTSVQLGGTYLNTYKLTGTWRIIKGDTLHSGFSDIHDPRAIFKGTYFENYILEWATTTGESIISDSITLRFLASLPITVSAGTFYLVYDTDNIVLNGTPLINGLIGRWSVISEDSADFVFSDRSIANAICKGKPFNIYNIRWSITNGIEEIHSDAKLILGNIFIDARDGKKYKEVKIGSQIWMAENLRATKYNDNTEIPLVADNTAWGFDNNNWDIRTHPAICWYRNDSTTNIVIYNWYTVGTGRLCPIGWHVPSDSEWTILTDYLGGESVAGGKLKETGTMNWSDPNNGATNEYGFTALPGGYRSSTGEFDNLDTYSTWWSSTTIVIDTLGAYTRYLVNKYTNLFRDGNGKVIGYQVRCLKDN